MRSAGGRLWPTTSRRRCCCSRCRFARSRTMGSRRTRAIEKTLNRGALGAVQLTAEDAEDAEDCQLLLAVLCVLRVLCGSKERLPRPLRFDQGAPSARVLTTIVP